MIRPTLYIMAKAPIMGRAKTRLAADIGVTHAKRIYRRMMSGVSVIHKIRAGTRCLWLPRRLCWAMFPNGRAMNSVPKSLARSRPNSRKCLLVQALPS